MAVAKKLLSFAEMAKQSADLDKLEAAQASKVAANPDFFSSAAPSSSDLLSDIQLRDLQARQDKLQSQIKAAEVYGLNSGEDVTAQSQPRDNWIAKGADVLSRPLYGMVGTAKYLLGQRQGTFDETVLANMNKDKQTFGSLLRSVGAPTTVAMPVGLAMDIIADPINWVSGGMAGLSRTTGAKLIKGAVTSPEAFGEATKLAGSKTLYNLTKLIPGLNVNKKLALKMEEMVKAGVSKDSQEWANQIARVYTPSESAVGKLVGKARIGKENLAYAVKNASDRYDTLTNWNLADRLEARAIRDLVIDELGQMARSSSPKMNALVEKVSYSPARYEAAKKAEAAWRGELEKQGMLIKQVYNKELGRYESPKLVDIRKSLGMDVSDNALNIRHDVENLSKPELVKGIETMVDDSLNMINKGDQVEFPSSMYSVDAMNDEAELTFLWNSYQKALAQTMSDEKLKSIEKVQGWITKGLNAMIKDPKRVEQIMDSYDVMRGIFVNSKISSLSPSSIICGSIGNPTMELMYGFNILDPANKRRLQDALAVIVGADGGLAKLAGIDRKRAEKVLNWMTTDKNIVDLWQRRPNDFMDAFGLDLTRVKLRKKVATEQKVAMTKAEAKIGGALEADKEQVRKMVEEVNTKQDYGTGASKFFEGGLTGYAKFKKGAEAMEKTATGAKKYAAKAFNYFTARSRDFQKVDQTHKLKTFLRLVQDGVTESELLKITNNLLSTNARIFKDDIASSVWRDGKKYFTIKPEKSMEIVNDIYMNYAAMPALIKSLRVLPIVGSPFFAFSYAMLAKTGKTALSNPAAFNKINFLLQELSGDKSPLEREALKSKYYSYLNTPGMTNLGENLPIFKGRQIYINLAQMVPYYSLNVINPSQRGFNDDIRGRFATTIDTLPVFKGPLGQVLMDYLVLPAIIQDQNPPVNMFGTPLYEKNAGLATKMAYAGRSLLEALTPSAPMAALTTVLNPWISDEMMQWIPSYPGRKTGFAARGKTTVGVTANEDPASRWLRSALSIVGVNLYPVDLVNISNEVKKRTK